MVHPHHPRFTIDEDALKYGMKMFVNATFRLLDGAVRRRREAGLSAGGPPVYRNTCRHAVRQPGRALRARAALYPVLDSDVGDPELSHHGNRVRRRSRQQGWSRGMNVALVVIFAFLALAVYLGIRARRGKDMDLEEWTVGGRSFGTIFMFLLLAGEIYTTFTFLGGSGVRLGLRRRGTGVLHPLLRVP